ncbi:ABC transporter substrate-binding protein [Microbispora bryophytorum]|uniref:ABC transporter substrate-binding protein n=1 Tax=Microbispora bryophytorum TaxID=1460882 RepID=UPI0033F009AF
MEDVKAYEKILATFEKSHPKIDVEFKPFQATEYNTILATGLSGSAGPDVAQLRAYGGLQPLVEAGRLVPLDGRVEALSGFDAKLLEGAKGHKDGRIYGVPFAYQTLQVLYDKRLFGDNGIQPPATWDDMIAAAGRLKAAGITPFAVAAGPDATWTLPIVHEIFGNARYGSARFRDALLSGAKKFTDPDFTASITLLKDLEPCFPKDVVAVKIPDVQALFATGKAAMYPTGSFDLAPVLAANPSLEVGAFQVPPSTPGRPTRPRRSNWSGGWRRRSSGGSTRASSSSCPRSPGSRRRTRCWPRWRRTTPPTARRTHCSSTSGTASRTATRSSGTRCRRC